MKGYILVDIYNGSKSTDLSGNTVIYRKKRDAQNDCYTCQKVIKVNVTIDRLLTRPLRTGT